VSLNAVGKEQAQQLAAIIHTEPKAIYSSDLIRALETAKPLAEKFGLSIVEAPDFREFDFGVLEGKGLEDAEVKDCRREHANKDFSAEWNTPMAEGAETYNQVVARFTHALTKIARKHPGGTVVVFSHMKAIHTFMRSLLQCGDNECERLGNCGIAYVDIDLDEEKLIRFIRQEVSPLGAYNSNFRLPFKVSTIPSCL